jgi:hypothetical protein
MMVYSPIQLSFGKFVVPALVFLAEANAESHRNYTQFQHRLSKGWIFGRRIVGDHRNEKWLTY